MQLVFKGHKDIVALLLDKARDTLDVNQAGTIGITPLLAACVTEHKDIVALLLDKARDTLDVNQADTNGYTPLHAALQMGHTDTVALLLDFGADKKQCVCGGVQRFNFVWRIMPTACMSVVQARYELSSLCLSTPRVGTKWRLSQLLKTTR